MATIAEALGLALSHHQKGQLQQAENIYRQILAVEPRNADALHLLGFLAYQVGRPEIAIEHIKQAIEISPGFSAYHSNLGIVYRSQGRVDDAMNCYKRAFEIDPRNADCCNNIAILHADRRETQQAIEWYNRAIAANPQYAEAYSNLGNVYSAVGQRDQAIASYEQALRIRPNFAEAHDNLGVVLANCGEFADAIDAFEHAIQYKPDFPQPYNNRGNALSALGRQQEAIASFQKALELNPAFPEAYSNLANSLTAVGQTDDAIRNATRALELRPKYSGALSNLGMAQQHCGNADAAHECFSKALSLEPENPTYEFNLALNMLLRGDFENGWERYEVRFRQKHVQSLTPVPTTPKWNGEDLNGKSVLILPEQGLGDIIQFARYIPLLKQRGASRIILQCQTSLQRLMRSLPGIDEVLDLQSNQPITDYWIHVMSLPRAFQTRLETIPQNVPYLSAAFEDIQAWKNRLADVGVGKRVGIVWSGSRVHAADHFRSIPLATLDPLADVPGIQFISLQKDRRDEPAGKLSERLIDHTSHLNDLADTAALIANLDLVISVDTSIVHLAGAMNKPVWVLLHAGPDFRWLMNREDSPWYPSAMLYRQSKITEWSPVIEKMKLALLAT